MVSIHHYELKIIKQQSTLLDQNYIISDYSHKEVQLRNLVCRKSKWPMMLPIVSMVAAQNSFINDRFYIYYSLKRTVFLFLSQLQNNIFFQILSYLFVQMFTNMHADVVSETSFPSPLKGCAVCESMTYSLNRI